MPIWGAQATGRRYRTSQLPIGRSELLGGFIYGPNSLVMRGTCNVAIRYFLAPGADGKDYRASSLVSERTCFRSDRNAALAEGACQAGG